MRTNASGSDRVVAPTCAAEVADILRRASREGTPVAVRGGGTSGRIAPDPGILIETRALQDPVDHSPQDLVATFGAGCTLARAEALVAAHGQELPLSAPHPERATLGGIVAGAAEGPTLHAFGPVRDQVLGLEIVHGDGRVTKTGGRVVKNVTGYDLVRLCTGSRGRLGVITHLHLRLRPRPEARGAVVFGGADPGRALEAAGILRKLGLPLFALHVTGGIEDLRALSGHPFQVIASLRGPRRLVEALRREAPSSLTGLVRLDVGDDDLTGRLQTPFDEASEALRLSVPPLSGTNVFSALRELPLDPSSWVLDVETGRLGLSGLGTALGDPGLRDRLPGVLRKAGARILRWPSDLEAPPPPSERSTGGVEEKILRAFDPSGILRGGRTP